MKRVLLVLLALLWSGVAYAQEAKPIWQNLTTSMTEQDVENLLGKTWKGNSPQAYLREFKEACYRIGDNKWFGYIEFKGPGGTISRIDVTARNQEGDANADNMEAQLTAKYGNPINRNTATERASVGRDNLEMDKTTTQWRADGLLIQLKREAGTPYWKLAYIVEGAAPALPL